MNQVTEFSTPVEEEVIPKAGVVEFDVGAGSEPVMDPIERERAVGAHSALLGVPTAPVRGMLEANDSSLQMNAESRIDTNQRELVNQTLSNQLTDQISLLEEEIQQTEGLKRLIPSHLTALLTSEDPVQAEYAAARLGKFFLAKQLIGQRVQQSEDYWLGDLADAALSGVFDAAFIKKRKENALRLESLVLSDLSPEEFEAEFVSTLDEMADQGFFTNDNQFYLMDFVDFFTAGEHTAEAAILDRWSAINTLLILPEVGGIVKLAKGTATALKGAASATALMAPTVAKSVVAGTVAIGANAANDIARLVGLKKVDPSVVSELIDSTIIIDDMAESAVTLGNHTSPSVATPSVMNLGETWSHSSSQAILRFELESEAVQEAFDIVSNAGQAVDADKFAVLKDGLIEKRQAMLTQSEAARNLDTVVTIDPAENILTVDIFGTRQGKPFVDASAAQRFADQVGGEVRQWHNSGEYVVVKSHNVPTDAASMSMEDLLHWKATEIDELGQGGVRTWFGSTLAKTTWSNNAVLKQGEAAFDRWTNATKKNLNKVDSLVSKKEGQEVFAIFDLLRDGVVSTDKTFGLSTSQFKTQFRTKWGRAPTDAQVAVFKAYQEALDVDLFFKSDIFFKRAVNDGVVIYPTEAGGNFRVVPEDVSKLDPESLIWDADAEKFVEVGSLPENRVVFRNYDPFNQDIHGVQSLYFTKKSATTRRLYHTDVMARNTGGSRIYDRLDASYFVKQNRTKTMVDGTEVKGSPGTMMAVRSEKEARSAVEQINRILTKIDELADGAFDYASVRALGGNQTLRQTILANNEFLPDLQDIDGLVDLFEERGLQLGEKFDFLGDGEKLIDPDVVGGFGDMRMSHSVDIQAISPNARGAKPLVGYGGRENHTLGAQQAIRKSLVQSQANMTERAYMARSINGFLKSAMETGVLQNPEKLKGLTLKQRLLKAEIATSKVEGKRLALEQKTISHRMNQRAWGDASWQGMTEDLSEFLYDRKIPGAQLTAWASERNPVNALRGLTFDRYLGMFAVDQLYVQGSQIVNVMGIAGRTGMQGVAFLPIMRFLTINQAPEVLDDAARRFSKLAGLSEDQFKEMVTMYRASGRNIIDASLTELGNPKEAAGLTSNAVQKTRRAGRVFFNEGERWARISAHNTAYMEYVKKFPARKASDQHGRRWIAHRQDVLTQGMTSASRSPVEKLPFFQFMSYQFRINEAIFAGTFGGKPVLTSAERVRLATTHLVVYGMSGWSGLSFLAGKIADNQGIEADSKALALTRYGMLDAALTTITGEQTALSTRLGGGDGIWMLLKGYTENNIFETLGGPPLETAWQTAEVGLKSLYAVAATAYNLSNGVEAKDFEDVGETLVKAGRLFTTGNRTYNAYMAVRYQQYLTRSGALISNDITTIEAALLAFGVPLEEYNELWTNVNFRKLEKQMLKSTIKTMQAMHDEANVLLDRGDNAGYRDVRNQMQLHYDTLSLTSQEIVRREVYDNYGPMQDNIIFRDFQRIQKRQIEKGLQ